MRELSLHIMDIVQNSISADANFIRIEVMEDSVKDLLRISVEDNGRGMTPEFLKTVSDPFTTTRTTRKIGLGIPLLKMAAERCNGHLDITSEPGRGTLVEAWFEYGNIDRAPLGDMGETILTIVTCNPLIDFLYRHMADGKSFEFDTREIRKAIEGIEMNNVEVVSWMKDYLREELNNLYGGVEL